VKDSVLSVVKRKLKPRSTRRRHRETRRRRTKKR